MMIMIMTYKEKNGAQKDAQKDVLKDAQNDVFKNQSIFNYRL
jgi:hypothetical protein